MNASAAGQIIRCPKCGANNRVSAGKSSDKQPVCGRCKTPLPAFSDKPLTVTDANFSETIENSPLPVLLDLWAIWCGPCRLIAPTIDALAKELAGKVLVGKLNIDQEPVTTSRFGVRSIPTLLVLKDGREIDRIVGVQSKEAILSRLQRFL